MNPKQFSELFRDLINRTLSESPAPVSQMILELELAKARLVQIQLDFLKRQSSAEISKAIVLPGKFGIKGN